MHAQQDFICTAGYVKAEGTSAACSRWCRSAMACDWRSFSPFSKSTSAQCCSIVFSRPAYSSQSASACD